MKILIINTLYYPLQLGGAEKSVQILAETLVKLGHEVVVVSSADNKKISFLNGVKIYYTRIRNLYQPYYSKREKSYKKPIWHMLDAYNLFNRHLNGIIKIEKPDVLHTNNLAGFSSYVWKIAKKNKIPVVHTLRDYYLLCITSTMYNKGKNCTNRCNICRILSVPKKNYSHLVSSVVGISSYILNKHKQFGCFNKAKEEVVYNSITVPQKIINDRTDNNIRIGYVGSLSSKKGIEFMLSNYEKITDSRVTLHVYGKADNEGYDDFLKNKYNNLSVFFEGFKKVEEIYPYIDILIVPSLWNEPFGRIVPEANSYGIPVLVANSGGLTELINPGVNGYVFDPNIYGDFEQKLELIIDKFKTMNPYWNIEKYESTSIANQYLNIYKEVLN